MTRFSKKNLFWLVPLAIGGVALLIFVAMSLWNWLMPSIFHLPVIGYWETAGLMLLFRLIFGFGGHHGRHRFRHRNHFGDRWEKMTPEERKKFSEHLKHHHQRGWCHPHDFDSTTSGGEQNK